MYDKSCKLSMLSGGGATVEARIRIASYLVTIGEVSRDTRTSRPRAAP